MGCISVLKWSKEKQQLNSVYDPELLEKPKIFLVTLGGTCYYVVQMSNVLSHCWPVLWF